MPLLPYPLDQQSYDILKQSLTGAAQSLMMALHEVSGESAQAEKPKAKRHFGNFRESVLTSSSPEK